MNYLMIFTLVVSFGLLCGCESETDKANIRLAATAFRVASDADTRNSDRTLVELQKAIDVVSDKHARSELIECQSFLGLYKAKQKLQEVTLQSNLLDIGHGTDSTKGDFDAALAKAKADVPLPDEKPIFACEYERLPALTR